MKKCLLLLFVLRFPDLGAQDSVRTHPFVCGNWFLRSGFEAGINQVFVPGVIKRQNTGFSSGLFMEYKLNYRMSLYPQALVSFVTYKEGASQMESTFLELPMHLLLKPVERTYAVLVSLGPDYKKDLATPAGGRWFTDLGIAFQHSLRYTTICPEIRFSYSRDIQAIYLMIHFKG